MAAAAKKNNKTKAPAKSGAPAGRRSVSGRTGAEAKTPAMPPEREENRLYRLLGGLACLLLALCTAVSYFQADALLLGLLRQALTGLFGYGYWLWAAAFLAMGLFFLASSFLRLLSLCAALTVFAILLSIISRSENISSRFIVSISLTGLTEPST